MTTSELRKAMEAILDDPEAAADDAEMAAQTLDDLTIGPQSQPRDDEDV